MVFLCATTPGMAGVLALVLDHPIFGMVTPIGVGDIIIGDHRITDPHIMEGITDLDHLIPFIKEEGV